MHYYRVNLHKILSHYYSYDYDYIGYYTPQMYHYTDMLDIVDHDNIGWILYKILYKNSLFFEIHNIVCLMFCGG